MKILNLFAKFFKNKESQSSTDCTVLANMVVDHIQTATDYSTANSKKKIKC